RSGRRIRQIFENEGEEAFRRLEVEISPDFTALEKIVISPGGGWITNPGIFEALPSGTLTVWLKVSPQEVARRLANSFGQNVRPLLSGSDPRARIEALLAEREPLYRRAAVTVDTEARRIDGFVQDIASSIQGGTPPPRSA